MIAAGILPWRIWLSANGVHGDHSLGRSFDVPFLAEHRSRVWPAIKALVSQIQPSGLDARLFVPLGVAVTLVALLRWRGRRLLPAYYLGVGLLYFIGLVWAYWTSPFTDGLYDSRSSRPSCASPCHSA